MGNKRGSQKYGYVNVVYLPDDIHYMEVTDRDWIMYKALPSGNPKRMTEEYARAILDEFPQTDEFRDAVLAFPYLERLPIVLADKSRLLLI